MLDQIAVHLVSHAEGQRTGGSRKAGITSEDDIFADDQTLGRALDGTVGRLPASTDCIIANHNEARVSVLRMLLWIVMSSTTAV